MSVIVGLIGGNKIVLGSDTKVVNISDFSDTGLTSKKVGNYKLDGIEFLYGAAGAMNGVSIFENTLRNTAVPYSIKADTVSIANLFLSILRSNNISDISILIGGVDNGVASLFRVNYNDGLIKCSDNGYLVCLPGGSMIDFDQINVHKNISDMNISEMAEVCRQMCLSVMMTDPNKTVNDEFVYEYLDK